MNAWGKSMNVGSTEYILEAARNTIKKAGVCFMITVNEKKEARARLMQPFPPEDDLTIWLGAESGSGKIEEIQHHSLVTLAYQDPSENAYVSLMGQASIITSLQLRRKYWDESFRAFWPNGPDGQDYLLIRVSPYKIEVLNLERNITPEPYGLSAAELVKEGAEWVVQEA